MSGYKNSGLTREAYEDRDLLREAAAVIERRWPERVLSVGLVRKFAESIEVYEENRDA